MKIGRNDPCPCGSGKKYKRCCYQSGQSTSEGQDLDIRDILDKKDDDSEADNYYFQKKILSTLINLRRISLDRKPHIKMYYKARKLYEEITTAMVNYHDSGKFELKVDKDFLLPEPASGSVISAENSFDLNTEDDPQAFYELMIYKSAPNMNCITEEFIKKHWYKKPEKIELLQSMQDSSMGLFEITGIDMNEGYAYLKEVFTGIEYRITDIGMSGNHMYEDIYIYTRIISYHDICFGSGLNLIFYKNDTFIEDHIRHHKKNYKPAGEFLRFTQLYKHYTTSLNKIISINPLEK